MSTFKFTFVCPTKTSLIKLGSIMFLPPRDLIPKNSHTDPKLHIEAFNHPVVILSCPESKSISVDSVVKIAIITSFNGISIKRHLSTKDIKARSGTIVAERAGYLRVVTASKPHAKDTLKLRNGKGMKRDYAYVNFKDTYKVSLGALARYGFGKKEEVDAYRLTNHAVRVLAGEVATRERNKALK